MSEATKPKWVALPQFHNTGRWHVLSEDHRTIAENLEERDARLIVAAVSHHAELVEALALMMACDHHVKFIGGQGRVTQVLMHQVPADESTADACECYEKARALLPKIEREEKA